ncbi:fimbrial protein (plasmid) [Enterobacter hormaechei]|uniref:fimbrial protein n=1 Tax=Enterobacter ludwigii TaxID=299767 RepID=UPI001BE1020F|nr:fimbrial protein [Enterobacter ludwigii]MBT1850634.1 type 1 fimbrial protein [Enterobacter ludwigii]
MKFIKIPVILFFLILVAKDGFAGSTSATINITGRITASPCTVDTETVNQSIDLGKVYAHDISAGSGSDWKSFQLSLSKCPVGTSSVTVTFTGNPASDNNYFANSGSAEGVVLQISDSAHSVSYGNSDTLTESIDADRNVVFPLEARMYNPGNKITSGDFNAVVQIDFTYQ